jgi:hypothetical protein
MVIDVVARGATRDVVLRKPLVIRSLRDAGRRHLLEGKGKQQHPIGAVQVQAT